MRILQDRPSAGAGCGPIVTAGLIFIGAVCFFGGPGGWIVTLVCVGIIVLIAIPD